MTPAYARRIDANHREIELAARRVGWQVWDLSQCAAYVPGIPDGLWARHGLAILVEYKAEGGRLSRDERIFHAEYTGPIEVCRGLEDVERITREWWPRRIMEEDHDE